MKSAWRKALAFLAVFTLASAAQADDAIEYTVSVTGVEDSDLKDAIIGTSELLDKSKRPVPTLRALRRRVDASLTRVAALLRARAYYAAKLRNSIERNPENSAVVTIEIELGPVYRIDRYDVRVTTPGEPRYGLGIPFSDLGLKPGDIALSEVIVAANGRLLNLLGRKAYPLAKIADRKVVVNHETRTLSVDIAADVGLYSRFGAVRTEGLESVDPEIITRHIAWVRGKPFDTEELEKTRRKLRQTGLFSSVTVRHEEKTDDKNELEVVITVKERKHRSIGAGGAYSSTEGLLGKLFWEHRNLWGGGERLRLRGEVGEIRQGVFGDFRISDFLANDQDLVFDTRASLEQREGFDSTEVVGVTRLERRFSSAYAGSVGIGFDFSDVEENGETEQFTFLTLPLTARRDTSDDLLDPSRGGRDTLTFTPNVGILDTDVTFFATQLYDTRYLQLLPKKKLILAGWARIGTIVGEQTLGIPANKRLYAGGAGSVRGYALDSIDPLDAQNDPIGGRSSTEFGAELRWRISGPFGAVAFVEAGGVYDGSVPDWGQDLQWGAGLGARYLTKIGPLRLDIAVPLNRRNAVDDSFQFLVSLGQAF